MYKKAQNWIEIDRLPTLNLYEDIIYDTHELVMAKNDYQIVFYRTGVQLKAQEYKFLLGILKQNGKKISANKLMKQIGAGGEKEDKQDNSYRIKGKIKAKLKSAMQKAYPDSNIPFLPDENKWVLFDSEYQINQKLKIKLQNTEYPQQIDLSDKVFYTQYFDFEKLFPQLITVKEGFYYSEYIKVDF